MNPRARKSRNVNTDYRIRTSRPPSCHCPKPLCAVPGPIGLEYEGKTRHGLAHPDRHSTAERREQSQGPNQASKGMNAARQVKGIAAGTSSTNTKKISELHMGKERCWLRGLDHLHGTHFSFHLWEFDDL
ncbi:hypothetical protein L6164_027797 [Bauhinia variegata]|uniref:Uncharacterized protein n=1 Tax=Bauhinia variegata TaxID=167791 RepID=A0ACB9LVF2_BAUVA|nr:hypothetical protein L6164_027797 [Bauhinia variegata]